MNGYAWATVAILAIFLPIFAYGFNWKWGRALGLLAACVVGGWLAGLAVNAAFGISA